MHKIVKLQKELKATKDLYNKFGGYSYRSAESILQALKPLLEETETYLMLSDELVNIGERYYVKAVAKLYDATNESIIAETVAYAREEENKKGMDGSQITGASSSYARKYALNGMFLIDDCKDSDATNTHDKEEKGNATDVFKNLSKEVLPASTELKCEACGEVISQRVSDFSMSKYNRRLCMACQKKEDV